MSRYGVSRVYHQQCGYTLLDAQSMHDKMVSMLKLMPGGGLDPSAGKTKCVYFYALCVHRGG